MPFEAEGQPEALNIADWFLGARVREGRGERTAIVAGDSRLTYRDVQALAHRFAHTLCALGVQPEQRVIVALPDGPEFVGALFGILTMGGVVVMVNPELRPEEIAYFYEYTGARVAIWLFSGGTTGRPKAVVQSHFSFVNTTELYAQGVIGYREDDVTISVPKLYFGYATGSNLFFPFAAGATSVLFSEKVTAELLFEKIRAHRPTILVNVPTMVNHMVAHPDARAWAPSLASLRLATSAGEALPALLHRRWMETFGVELLDGLGTAEMWHVFLTNRPGAVRPGTLGQAVPGFDVKVCDDDGRELGPGEVGALRVRGRSRAIGYWRQMERTMAAFRGEWYVTGDLCARDADGYFSYCGRADELLKVGGKWLAPQEVESRLLEHPAVKECAVVGSTDASGLVKPRAYVVATGPASPGLGDELKAFVRAKLDAYKHPRELIFVDALPRTHLGKVDRGKLRRT